MSGRVGPLKPSFINTYSLDFDGMDDYVDVGEIPPLFKNFPIGTAKDNPWSASMWVKGSTSGAFLQLPYVETNIVGARAFAFAFNGTYLYFGGKFANIKIRESEPFAGGVTAFSTTDWNHVLMTFDGVDYTALLSYKLYVNGTLIPIELIPTNITDFRVKSILIGGTQLPWLGKIDEVSLFDAELTTSNVTSIYNGGKPTDLTPLNPIAWYRMGDNGSYKSPQWLIPSNENKDKVSNYILDFDGVNDYVNIPNNTELNFSSAYSVSFWIKTTSAALLSPISNQSKFLIRLYAPANQIRLQLYDGSNGFLNLDNTQVFNDGKWHHIAFTTEATTTADKIIVYFDGVALTNKGTQLNVGSHLSAFAYEIGRNSGTWNFNGGIDEVSIYDSELSASEINDIYNGGEPTTISGAVAHYKMGEEATFSSGVWTVPDAVGSNDGTSANMTIEDRVGTAPSSSNNAVSFNMDLIDRVEDTP